MKSYLCARTLGGSHSDQVPALGMDMHEYGLDVVSLCVHMGLSRFYEGFTYTLFAPFCLVSVAI